MVRQLAMEWSLGAIYVTVLVLLGYVLDRPSWLWTELRNRGWNI